MPATTILALDGIARMTRAEARLLAAAGRLGMDVRALAPSIEAVVARHAGVKTRLRIVVPTLANPRLPYGTGTYSGTWVEWSILAGCFACFILLYTLFTKFFPIVSIWEVREGRDHALHEVHERVKMALPGEGRLTGQESTTF